MKSKICFYVFSIDTQHANDKAFLENKFKEERISLEKETTNYLSKINEMDLCIHVAEYEAYMDIVLNLETFVEDYQKRVERNIVEEELLMSYKLDNTFENWWKAKHKIEKLALFWKKAYTFYEHKKAVMNTFSMDQDIQYSLDIINQISIDIKDNKKDIQKYEEVLLRVTRNCEDDVSQFRDFLVLAKKVIDIEEMDDDTKHKIAEMEENKKIDPAFKQTIKILCLNKGFVIA